MCANYAAFHTAFFVANCTTLHSTNCISNYATFKTAIWTAHTTTIFAAFHATIVAAQCPTLLPTFSAA